MQKARISRTSFIILGITLLLTTAAWGQWTETTLYPFTGASDGAGPYAGLIFDSSGNLYGTTYYGGNASGICGGDDAGVSRRKGSDVAKGKRTRKIPVHANASGRQTTDGCGVVFELTPATGGGWDEIVLYTFTGGDDGGNPEANLVFDAAGNLYGTTVNDGANGAGTVFELSPPATPGGAWTETTLWSFADGADGGYPYSNLVFDAAGNLYGTTSEGGDGEDCGGCGLVFELTPTPTAPWTETVLYTFTDGADGGYPYAGVVFDSAGNLYGTTYNGGDITDCGGCGVVFELTPNFSGPWTETVLYTFTDGADGAYPDAGVILDASGNLYGTATEGGTNAACDGSCYGVVFELTPTDAAPWTENVLWTFLGGNDGSTPYAGVIFDAAGNLYSTAEYGGANNYGTVFELSPAASAPWTETTLWSFTDENDGAFPFANVIFDSSGNLYSTAASGGANDNGVVFELSPPPSTTTVSCVPDPSTFGQTVTCAATVAPAETLTNKKLVGHPRLHSLQATPTGTVSWSAYTDCAASTLSSSGTAQCVTSALPVGTDVVVATYSPNTGYSGSSGDFSQVVNPAPTTTSVISSLNPSESGEAVTFTATVATGSEDVARNRALHSRLVSPQAPTGTVAFTFNGTTITGCGAVTLSSSGTAQCTTSGLSAGTDAIVATYSGDINYSGSNGDLSQVVTQATTTTVLTSSLNPSAVGQSVTFTAAVTGSSPTGTVSFTSNGTAISGCSAVTLASDSAVCATSFSATGTYVIGATYSGDSNNSGSSGSLSQTVKSGITATTTALTSSINPSVVAQSVAFTAVVAGSSPTGTVGFTSNGAAIIGCGAVTLVSGQAACTTSFSAAGTYSIVATYSGDVNNTGSTSSSLSQVVNAVTGAQLEVTASPSSLSIVAGRQGTVALETISTTGTLVPPVTFSCSGLPSDASCTFSPSSVTSLPASVTMTISTTAADARLQKPGKMSWAFIAMMLPGLLLMPGAARKIKVRKLRQADWLLLGLLVLLTVSWVGCCGTAGGGVVGIQTKTYAVTVTASAPGATAGTAAVTLKVCSASGC